MKKKHFKVKIPELEPTISLCSLKRTIRKNFKSNYISKYFEKYSPFDNLIINSMINNKGCHIVAVFKDYMIADYIDEFLKRLYLKVESRDKIPRLANFYKNYSTFFCKPTFRDFKFNLLSEHFYEKQAELFYKEKLQSRREKNKKKMNVDVNIETLENEDVSEESFTKIEKTIFNSKLRSEIDNSILFSPSKSRMKFESSETLWFDEKKVNEDFSGIGKLYLITKNSNETSLVNLIKSISSNQIKVKKNSNYNMKKGDNKKKLNQISSRSRNNFMNNYFNKNHTQSIRKGVNSTTTLYNSNNSNTGKTQNFDNLIQCLNKKIQYLSKKTTLYKYHINKPKPQVKINSRNNNYIDNILSHNSIKSTVKVFSNGKKQQNSSNKIITKIKLQKNSKIIKKPVHLLKRDYTSKSIINNIGNEADRQVPKQRSQISLFKKEDVISPNSYLYPYIYKKEENKNISIGKVNGCKNKPNFTLTKNNITKGRNSKNDLGSNKLFFSSSPQISHLLSSFKAKKKNSIS